MTEVYKKNPPGQSYPNKLLQALQAIIADPSASVAQRLQAVELSTKILPLRKTPRRKTDKDKAILAALEGNKKKKEEPKPLPENSNSKKPEVE